MYSELCEKLGIDVPIFAFSHCRDVVVEVSKAGGLGVLGAGWFSAEQFSQELDWIDTHIGDKPYGVDIVVPQKYEGMEEPDAETLEAQLMQQVPEEHINFATALLEQHGVPELDQEQANQPKLAGWTYATALPLFEQSLNRPNCKLLANALGTPPADIIDRAHADGMLVGALCGKLKQAIQHKEAGLDFIVAVGGEGGGHAGEISSIVLWPQAIDAVAPLPVLAAGGISSGRQMLAAMATGAAGVWMGTQWLTVAEAEAQPAQKDSYLKASSEDTVRSRAWTGKPARLIRNRWTDAWDAPDTPAPLDMPLQGLVTHDAMLRTELYAGSGDAQAVAMNPCGQAIGMINEVETCRDVMFRLLSEYADALEQVNQVPGS
jgi:NAD(P)H-dependent flavin oxidoreductase YrpB (nitropropane dioxygenase family)